MPERLRLERHLSDAPGAAWSWVMGSLPPPQDVELHVVCPVFGLRETACHFEFSGAHWHCFRLRRFEPLFLRRRFARQVLPLVRSLRPDVIHGWGGESGCGLVATYLGKDAVVSVQGLLRMLPGKGVDEGPAGLWNRAGGIVSGWFRCRLEAMTYRRAALCLCESETACEALKRLYGIEGVVSPYPLRTDFLGPCSAEAVADKPNQGAVRFLFVGQAVARKGIEDLRAVQRMHPELDVTFVTGGKCASEIAALMRTHDVFVLPSYGDTGPTAIKEALAMGMPVIAYDNTGPKELLEKYGGTLVRTGDVAALASAMTGCHPKRNRNMSVAVRVREDLGRERAWCGYLDAYARRGFALPPSDQLRGAVGRRVAHFAGMLRGGAFAGKVVVSFHTGVRQNVTAALRAKWSGKKVVREINEWPLSVTWHENRVKQWFEMHVLPLLFDGFICISDVLVDFCRERGRKDVPILKLPMTVDCAEIDAVASAGKSADGRRRVVYAGSASESKDGVETLRRLMASVDADLDVVSGVSHDEAVARMKGADCLVLARPDSQQARAGFPTKLGEYLATGVPVVVTRTGEIPQYLEDGATAYLATPGDEREIAARIREVLEKPERAAKVGLAGREVARRRFDWRNHKKELQEWLRRFI